MFIGRNPDGTIYGLWTVRQFQGQEELPDNDPAVAAFINRPLPKRGLSDGDLAALLVTKGVITSSEVAAATKP